MSFYSAHPVANSTFAMGASAAGALAYCGVEAMRAAATVGQDVADERAVAAWGRRVAEADANVVGLIKINAMLESELDAAAARIAALERAVAQRDRALEALG